MYKGELFKKSYRWAKLLHPSKIYILSAKYGLLELDKKIDPYNVTLNSFLKTEKKMWAYKVYKQLQQKGIAKEDKLVFLCGQNYRQYLMRLYPNAICPIKGLSMGNQLKYYNKKIRESEETT